MGRMKPRERVDLDELRPPARVAPQVDSSRVAAPENAPRLEGDALRLAHARRRRRAGRGCIRRAPRTAPC